MWGFVTDRGASALAEGWRVHYNLIRDHMTLGKTPAEAAGLPEVVGFRWLSVVKAAGEAEKPKA